MLPENLLDQIADLVAQKVVDKLRADSFGMVDQGASPLGPRRHAALARKLISAGDGRAAKVGRRWLLSREAIDEALGTSSKTAPENNDLLTELGLEKTP